VLEFIVQGFDYCFDTHWHGSLIMFCIIWDLSNHKHEIDVLEVLTSCLEAHDLLLLLVDMLRGLNVVIG
jgi:hypothetical protein